MNSLEQHISRKLIGFGTHLTKNILNINLQIELTTTFIVDVLRSEARVIDGSSTIEPFKWALWRNYLIHVSSENLHFSANISTKFCNFPAFLTGSIDF